MSQISFHVVFDTDDNTIGTAELASMPVDSDDYVYDTDDESWRPATEEEMAVVGIVEAHLDEALRDINMSGVLADEIALTSGV